MLEKNLSKIADIILENEKNANIDKSIIVYGLRSAIEQGVSIITAVFIGYIFGLTFEVILFLISFKFIRTFAGGYHCKTALSCYFVSNIIVILAMITIKFIQRILFLL